MSASLGVRSSTVAAASGLSLRASWTISTISPLCAGDRVAKRMPQTVAPIERKPAVMPTIA